MIDEFVKKLTWVRERLEAIKEETGVCKLANSP